MIIGFTISGFASERFTLFFANSMEDISLNWLKIEENF